MRDPVVRHACLKAKVVAHLNFHCLMSSQEFSLSDARDGTLRCAQTVLRCLDSARRQAELVPDLHVGPASEHSPLGKGFRET